MLRFLLKNISIIACLLFVLAEVPLANSTSCTPPPSGLVSWWKGESNALDSVSGNNGTLQGGVTFAAGEAGQAFSFNGSNSYVLVADAPALRLTNELTVEFWVKRQQLVPDYILNKGGDWSGNALNYGVAFAAPSDNSRFSFLFAGGIRESVSVTDFNWHHCAVTARNGDADAIFYVDGMQQPVVVRVGTPTINLYPSTQPLRIGAEIDAIATYFSADLIDELGIYKRVLSAAEIQAIYNAGSAGKCTPTSVVPVIASFSPSSASPGSSITITGVNFSPVPANNTVYFGAVKAAVTAASPTSLIVTVPSGATYAPITVTVNGLTAWANAPFLPTYSGTGTITSGSLAPRVDLADGSGPVRTAIADLDGDGKPDIISLNTYDGTIWIYRNISTNGSLAAASFAPPVILSVGGASDDHYALAVGDLDGDGRLDIVTVP
jgi:Concanavalin A-like lectin/glucanases superfamily/FG-GAP-like repeat/IPT/TIG domain